MPSVQYMNGPAAPFWDFISSLEQQGQNHPFFAQFAQNSNENTQQEGHPQPSPFAPWGWGGWGGRAFPHRGPPPPHEEATGENDVKMDDEKAADNTNDAEKEKDNDNGEGPPGTEQEGWGGHRCGGGRRHHYGEKGEGSDTEGWSAHRRCGGRRGRHGEKRGEGEGSGSDTEGWGGHRRCGVGRHGRQHGAGPHGFGPHGPHGHGHHGRGGFRGRGRGWGGPWGWGRGAPFGGDASFNPFEFVANLSNLFYPEFNPTTATKNDEDFTPEADIFDTPSGYVIHISLPGAKKEDVGVNWDAEKSELSIAGVIYRPGDEEFLKTLAVDERKVGPFERKIRLGTRASPAVVDAEGIVAKLEDGVLRVEVPRLESGFVEVRKVDVE